MNWLKRAARLVAGGPIWVAVGEMKDKGALPRGALANWGKSFVDNVIRDRVTPRPGSILHCDLAFGKAEHTGVYIGDNCIVELNGDGGIREVSPETFLNSSSLRTAISVYVACDEHGNVLHAQDIADRAKRYVGGVRNYNVVLDNCHQFTAACITGELDNPNNFFWMLSDLISERLNGGRKIDWRVWNRQET